MKRFIFFIFLTFFLASCATIPKQAENCIDYSDPATIDRIVATNPDAISEEQFYLYEFAILSGFSGSGGCYIEDSHIEWLRKAENSFRKRKTELKDEYNRHFEFADAYLNSEQYEKALEEYKSLKCQWGMELSEWLINNSGIKNGRVRIKEYAGRIHFPAGITAMTKDRNWLFIAYFKGPVYRYNRVKRKHAIIYMPKDQYDWCDALAFNGSELVIKLRDKAGVFIFDNESNKISEFKPAD